MEMSLHDKEMNVTKPAKRGAHFIWNRDSPATH